MITIKLDEVTAMQLAQFCKRAINERVKSFSANETETNEMMKALNTLREELLKEGFNPR
jgi:hypothetical protein